MIQLLLDYCRRRRLGAALLNALEQERPGMFEPDREALLAQFDIAGQDNASIELALPLDHIPKVAPLPADSRMPLSRNPLFVGRPASRTPRQT